MGKLSEFDDRFATIPPFHDCLLLAAAIYLVPFEHNGRNALENQYLCIFTQKRRRMPALLSFRGADMKKTLKRREILGVCLRKKTFRMFALKFLINLSTCYESQR